MNLNKGGDSGARQRSTCLIDPLTLRVPVRGPLRVRARVRASPLPAMTAEVFPAPQGRSYFSI